MRPVRVAVTGLNVADNPQPGLSVARCLLAGREGAQALVGITYDLHWTGVHAAGVFRSVYLVPPPWLDERAFVDGLVRACREAHVTAVLPSLDADVEAIARHRPELARAGLRAFVPTPEMLSALSDLRRPAVVPGGGILSPPSAVVNAAFEIPAAAPTLGYPLLLQSPVGESATAFTAAEAQVIGGRFLRWWGGSLVMRALVEGDDYQVALVASRGAVVAAVAVKVLTRGGNGSAWAVVTVHDEDLIALANTIVRRLDWSGPLSVEFVRETGSRRVWLVGSWPRFPVWIGAARAAGLNLPLLAVQAALGRRLARPHRLPPFGTGTMLALTSRDQISDVSALAALGTAGKLALNGGAPVGERVRS